MSEEQQGPEQTRYDTERKLRERIEQLERERDHAWSMVAKADGDAVRAAANALQMQIARQAAEAKLAKAIDALRDAEVCLRQSARGDATINDMETWADDARTTLAELEGGE